MSIIYDALKKVDKSLDKNSLSVSDRPAQTKVSPKFKPVYLYIFIVCLGLLLGNYIFNYFIRAKKTPSINLTQQIEPARIKPAVNKAPIIENLTPATPEATSNLPEPSLTLSGVFFEQNDGYALINNRIIKVGDTIENATVSEINLDGVKLEFNGKIIKLANPS